MTHQDMPVEETKILRISWIYDVISPFSYLSLKELDRLPKEVEIEYVPVLFAGLLSHHGQIGNAEIASKRRFTYRFALWRARRLGIPMRMPPAHPFNPLSALRLIIAAGGNRNAVDAVFDAVFAHGRDVTDAAVIDDLARQLGIDDAKAASSTSQVKQKLRENTEWAIVRGVFGVPTFVIGKEIFWGHDSLEMVIDYMRDPETFDDDEMQKAERVPVGALRATRRAID